MRKPCVATNMLASATRKARQSSSTVSSMLVSMKSAQFYTVTLQKKIKTKKKCLSLNPWPFFPRSFPPWPSIVITCFFVNMWNLPTHLCYILILQFLAFLIFVHFFILLIVKLFPRQNPRHDFQPFGYPTCLGLVMWVRCDILKCTLIFIIFVHLVYGHLNDWIRQVRKLGASTIGLGPPKVWMAQTPHPKENGVLNTWTMDLATR